MCQHIEFLERLGQKGSLWQSLVVGTMEQEGYA